MPNYKLTKKIPFPYTPSCIFSFIFSEYITSSITSSEEALKMCEHNFFQEIKRKVVLVVIYLLNYDSSKPTLLIRHLTLS